MVLFILTETSAGYALLKSSDKKLLKRDNLEKDTESAEQTCSLLQLKNFQKFDSAATALEEVAAVVEGKVTPRLASLLDSIKDEKKASLAVADPKLGNAINKLPQLSITPISDSTTADLYRSIRNHLPSLIPGLLPQDISTMSLGLSHSLSRHKLKFSPDKVDTMIVQAIALLDDLDKELNTYAMRVKEWYGWHFPEMGRIVNDNLAYARVIQRMGMRTDAANADLAEILPEEIETAVKAAAEVSMGTEITAEDLDNIQALATQVVEFTEYRQQLSSYLSARMAAIAPNLTVLVGDLVGARLIAHAGSLMNLAKSPASTLQILGAEKALFRALKTKHDTPKYGLIYHASLIGQATGKNKGKIARVLAAKAAIGIRVDALADWSAEGEGRGDLVPEEEKSALGIESRYKIERRLANLEGRPLRSKGVVVGPNGISSQPGKWEVKEARKYNPDADGLTGDEPAAIRPVIDKAKKAKKSKKEEVKLIEEVKEPEEKTEDGHMPNGKALDAAKHDSEDEEMEDEPSAVSSTTTKPLSEIRPKSQPAKIANGVADGDDKSDTRSTVSADTPDSPESPKQQEDSWQSSITGDSKEAKKARKKEKQARDLALSEAQKEKKKLKEAKLARRLERRERRQKRAERVERKGGGGREDEEYSTLAKQAGLSVSRYKRKLERGEIRYGEDGVPVSISKKDIKRARKAAEKAERKKVVESEVRNGVGVGIMEVEAETAGKKRKRGGDEGVEVEVEVGKSEKKKKKKSKG